MAFASTIDDSLFYLIDQFAGGSNTGPTVIPGDWTELSGTPLFPLGTKIRMPVVISGTHVGFATFTYLKYSKGTADAAGAKGICGIKASSPSPYVVCNDGGEILLEGPIAIALTTMTDGKYAFFWTGGVCPVNIVSGLDGNYNTDGTVAAGKGIVMSDGDSSASGVAGFSALVDKDTDSKTGSTTRGIAGGYALSDDA